MESSSRNPYQSPSPVGTTERVDAGNGFRIRLVACVCFALGATVSVFYVELADLLGSATLAILLTAQLFGSAVFVTGRDTTTPLGVLAYFMMLLTGMTFVGLVLPSMQTTGLLNFKHVIAAVTCGVLGLSDIMLASIAFRTSQQKTSDHE